MELHLLEGRKSGGYTTFGCYWEKGEVTDAVFELRGANNASEPVQSGVLAYWPDKSIKWSAHTADSEKLGGKAIVEPVKVGSEGVNGDGCKAQAAAETSLQIQETAEGWLVNTGCMSCVIPAVGNQISGKAHLIKDIRIGGKLLAFGAYPVFQLEHRNGGTERNCERAEYTTTVTECYGDITSVELEQSGPLQALFCFRGNHMTKGEAKMPFVIRMYLWSQSSEIKFVHTFLFDGVEQRDFLKGMGIRFDTDLGGKQYNRHVQYAMEKAVFHEAAVMLCSSYPRLEPEVLSRQLAGDMRAYEPDSPEEECAADMPVWNRYRLIQDSSYHFAIRKQTCPECCELSCKQGKRAMGAMAVTGENGGLAAGIRDFWQKCPGELEVSGLGKDKNAVTLWFYSPAAEAFDFRHYDTRSYPRSCYEGFEHLGASAYGIGVSSEGTVRLTRQIMTDAELMDFAERIQNPCVYVGTPEYYHEKRAFGYWSLPCGETESERWLEDQMDKAFAFYQSEIEDRDWYGLFDYGDVMHTYDMIRHTWKYDMGGFAWQNTELVPTYWLWLYFLRTGREDVFTLAEAMSRHCAEVDTYHFGPLQGLGSRHNVRHWGCSCKEPRIGMAGHHRFLYYLTADERLGDVMEDVKDADVSMSANPRNQTTLPGGERIPGIRSGPDWSSYVSNWMTHYERTLEEAYREKIETGISDIAATPFGFASGPDYGYDVEKAHLIYTGESETTPNQHLQICMGGPQIWLETADMLGDDRLKKMLSDLGAFYYLSREEKSRLTCGKILKRPFSWPMFATSISAFGAMKNEDEKLAAQTWQILINDLLEKGGKEGYIPKSYGPATENDGCREIAWNTTNCTAQWCLNVIMCLEFIREYLPAEI